MNQTIKKVKLLYFSPGHTTKSVLEGIAKGIGLPVEHYDITLPKNRLSLTRYAEEELLVLGLPVYSGRIPTTVELILKQLSGSNTPAVLVAVYGNRDIDDALLEMQNLLVTKGFLPLAGAAFIGEHSFTPKVATNRPDTKDLEEARAFGQSIATLLTEKDFASLNLQVRGNAPYKERKNNPVLGPTIGLMCNQCGTCVENCPTAALTLKETVEVDEHLCILCHSCKRGCEQDAITFGGRIPKVREAIIENFSARKDPEIFIAK